MTPEYVIKLGQDTLMLVLQIAGPVLIVALVVGLMVSVFQAVTQIHEMTLTFIPKILAVVAVVMMIMPWMMRRMLDFTTQIIAAFDSAGKDREDACRAVFKYLHELHLEQKGSPCPIRWHCTSLGDLAPRQKDWWNCGVFMLALMWCLAHRIPFDAISDAHMNSWRTRLTLLIQLGSPGFQ